RRVLFRSKAYYASCVKNKRINAASIIYCAFCDNTWIHFEHCDGHRGSDYFSFYCGYFTAGSKIRNPFSYFSMFCNRLRCCAHSNRRAISSIVVSKLDEEFFYLLKLLGTSVVPGVVIFGILSAVFVKSKEESIRILEANKSDNDKAEEDEVESYPEIIIRSLKIYLFVMALTFLGAGFEPFIERYLLDLSPLILYWIN